MKLARIMVVALALTLLAASTSFGAVIAFRTGTLNEVAVNAQTGLGGNIGLVPLATGSVPAGEIVNYTFSHPISSVSQFNVSVGGAAAVAWTGTSFGTQTMGAVDVTVDATHVAVAFNTALDPATANVTMLQLAGLRFNVAATGAVNDRVTATITSTLGQVSVTSPDVDIAILREPLTVTVAAADITSNLLTTGGSATATISITELFTNAFETWSATYPTQVKLNITVPSTLTLAGITVAPAATSPALLVTRNSAATANPALIDITAQDSNLIETIRVTLTFTSATTPVSLVPGPVSVQATLYPPTTVFPVALGTGTITTTAPATGRLRFAERLRPTPALDINFGVTSLTTDLLSLFNVYMAQATGFAGYDTGIAIQNASPVLIGAINPGTIQVNLYKSTGAAVVTYTTSATIRPGTGLSADGQLASGATWSVLLSQLLAAAPTPITGDWEGMVHFHTNFSGATGINYIADPFFAVQAQGYQMVDVRQWRNLTNMADSFTTILNAVEAIAE